MGLANLMSNSTVQKKVFPILICLLLLHVFLVASMCRAGAEKCIAGFQVIFHFLESFSFYEYAYG